MLSVPGSKLAILLIELFQVPSTILVQFKFSYYIVYFQQRNSSKVQSQKSAEHSQTWTDKTRTICVSPCFNTYHAVVHYISADHSPVTLQCCLILTSIFCVSNYSTNIICHLFFNMSKVITSIIPYNTTFRVPYLVGDIKFQLSDHAKLNTTCFEFTHVPYFDYIPPIISYYD